MDNTEAVEKLHNVIIDNPITIDDNPRWLAEEILAAFQADPLAYGIKPKPLGWVQFTHKEDDVRAKTSVGSYTIRPAKGGFRLQTPCEPYVDTKVYPTLEAAQAAAYDDLCKRVKELF